MDEREQETEAREDTPTVRLTGLGRDPRIPRGRPMRIVDEPMDLRDEPVDAGYWSPEALFSESKRVEEELEEKLDHRTDGELFAELGLAEGATEDDVRAAQRRLAKLHHPDRWATAPAEIAEEHEDAMRRINGVVATIRARDLL